MESKPIPILPLQASGHSEIGGASPVAINVVADATGAVTRRPGIRSTSRFSGTLAGEVTGIWQTRTGKMIATHSDVPGAYAVSLVSATSSTVIMNTSGDRQPQFVETEGMLAWADGRRPNRYRLSDGDVGPLGAAPPRCTHLCSNSSRLLANDLDNVTHVNYSAPATGGATDPHESWNEGQTAFGTSSFFAAEATPDPVIALASNSNEVYAFKATMGTAFAPDATSVFVPTSSLEVGISAPRSLIADDTAFAWLDNRRRFVLSALRGFEPISEPIQATIDAMARVDDCWGFRYHHGAVDALVWVFPTDGRAFAYQRGVGWAQWLGPANTAFPATAYHDVRDTREHLVGLATGQIGDLQPGVEGDMGATFGASVTTGFANHGTDRVKRCMAIRVAMRRGLSSSPESSLLIEWRDGLGAWSGPVRVGMGQSGDTEIVREVRGLGTYRRRQWRFSFHGAEALHLAGVEEDFEEMPR